MFLSIIIPIYNDEKYLEECLDSCLLQDISDEDYEIICVDDGSTDRTPEILRDYERKNSNVNVIFKQHGSKYGDGRNVGLEYAEGDYVWFVDHDDLIEENVLSQLKQKALTSEFDRLNFPCYIFREKFSDEELKAKQEGRLKPDFITYRGTIWSSIFRRAFLLDNDIWPLSKKLIGKKVWGADGFFVDEIRMSDARYASLEDHPYYYYRVSRKQVTAEHSFKSNMARIEGTIDPVLVLKEKYDNEVKEHGKARESTANVLMTWVHLCMMYLAPMDHRSFVEGKKKAKQAGVFPFVIVPEYSYTLKDCIQDHKKKGTGFVRTIGYYYSSYSLGLFLYRLSFWKSILYRAVKQSNLTNGLMWFRRK